jgi:hypothetical protein
VTKIYKPCLPGQRGSGCLGDGSAPGRGYALNKAWAAETGGVSNWGLPKIGKLTPQSAPGPARLAPMFPSIWASVIWRTSAKLDSAIDAWAFDFIKGIAVINARDSKSQVLMLASQN